MIEAINTEYLKLNGITIDLIYVIDERIIGKYYEMCMRYPDQWIVDEWVFTKKEIQSMRKNNPKWCIYHGLAKFSDCYHCK